MSTELNNDYAQPFDALTDILSHVVVGNKNLDLDEPIYQTIDEVKPMLSVKRRSIHIKLASLESVSSSTSSSSSSLSQNVVQSE